MSYQRSRILASACACVLGLAAANAFGQAAPADSKATTVTELEEVVVTGSFIKGTPEDSAMPVEVISYEELQDLGRPSNLDLVKNMSEVGGSAGEANRVNFYPIGAATINLRSLGARFTTVVFNGRRFPEQFSVNTGRFNNISWIPNAAIGSVETLKAGAGAIYGADAVSGVVNYITRKNVDGLEVNGSYRYIQDSDGGDYTADALWGKKYAGGNLMISVAYQHRGTLKEGDRPFGQRQYLENPASYTAISNPGNFLLTLPAIAGTPAVPAGAITPAGTATNRLFVPNAAGVNLQMGGTGLLRDPNCAALGGFLGWSATPNPVCYTNTADAEDLVVDSDSWQFYLEHNHTLDNGVKFHTELLAYTFTPTTTIASTFTNNPGSWPLTATGGLQVAPGTATNAFLVPGNTPSAVNLVNSLKNQDGSNALTAAQITALTTGGGIIALQNGSWRPFGNGGSPYPEGDIQANDTHLWRISEAISGNLPEFWGTKLEWEVGLTYSHVMDIRRIQDILVDRLQGALNGLGGPNCSGNTPGLNGCQYFNPFSSAYPSNVYSGAVNPGYVAGLANDRALVKWLYVPISLERDYDHYVFDPLIRGDTGITLPGGNIQMAIGAQFRMQTEDTILDDYSNRAINPCPTLGVTNCATTSQIGPLALARPANVLGAAASNFRNEFRRYPVAAAFLELQMPIIDNLELTVAGREEKFYSDVTDVDNKVFVPQAGLKWQPLDWMGVRASWGKTFSQVNPPRDVPGIATVTSLNNATFGIGAPPNTYTTVNYPNVDVKPEKGEYWDFGLLFNVGNFTTNLDYYSIEINDYARQMTANQLLTALAVPGESGIGAHINCSSDLLKTAVNALDGRPFIQLNGGNACTQGVNTFGPVGGGSAVGTVVGGNVNFFAAVNQTNSGKLTSKGIDWSASYRFDKFVGGSLTATLDATWILDWTLSDFVIAGVKVADGYDGVGFVNSATGKLGIPVEEYRGTLTLTYRYDIHTLNLVTTYLPSLINDSSTDFLVPPSAANNANIGNSQGITPPTAACAVSQPYPQSDLDAVPAGAGSGTYGNGTVTTLIGTARGFCGQQNTLVNSGHKLEQYINMNLTYRLQLPDELGLTLTIDNLLNSEPPFFRGIVSYNTAYGSPLMRNYKLGISKKF